MLTSLFLSYNKSLQSSYVKKWLIHLILIFLAVCFMLHINSSLAGEFIQNVTMLYTFGVLFPSVLLITVQFSGALGAPEINLGCFLAFSDHNIYPSWFGDAVRYTAAPGFRLMLLFTLKFETGLTRKYDFEFVREPHLRLQLLELESYWNLKESVTTV